MRVCVSIFCCLGIWAVRYFYGALSIRSPSACCYASGYSKSSSRFFHYPVCCLHDSMVLLPVVCADRLSCTSLLIILNVPLAVAYPARGAFRLINKEVQLSLPVHTTAGASNPFRTKKDGIMAATAVMDTRHITKVTEEEAMRAIKGMTLWVRQEPAAESLSMRLTRQPRRPMSMCGTCTAHQHLKSQWLTQS